MSKLGPGDEYKGFVHTRPNPIFNEEKTHLNKGNLPKIMDINDPDKIHGPTWDNNLYEVYRVELENFKADPIAMIKAGCLKIKTKDAEMKEFIPNKTQMAILNQIQEIRKKNLPVRMFFLKGRQFGITTLCQALQYSFTSLRSYMNALTMADDEDGSEAIAEITKTMHEEMLVDNPTLTPHSKKSNSHVLEFFSKKSKIIIDTANKRGKAGRKYTFQFVHLSEAAFFSDFSGLMKALMQTVPDKPETFVFIETTANGINDVCKFWRKIKKAHKEGLTNWIPCFLSWADHDEYTKPFIVPRHRELFIETMTKEEKELNKQYKLSLEQLNWRRYKIENSFQGDVDAFEVEYPLDDEQAFKGTAKRVFPEKIIKAQEAYIKPPIFTGEVEWVNRKATTMSDSDGYLKIWEFPKAERQYVIGADSCESALSMDDACAKVLDRSTWNMVAHLHAHIPPQEFGRKLFALGALYNWALLAPEVNGPGMVTVQTLTDLSYPNLSQREKLTITDNGIAVRTQEVGFHTNVKTKQIIIQEMVEAFRNMMIFEHDEDSLAEYRYYVVCNVTEDGHIKYGAEEGYHDDCVMASAIAIHHAKQIPDLTNRANRDNTVYNRPPSVTGY